jgi:hypothetical protein
MVAVVKAIIYFRKQRQITVSYISHDYQIIFPDQRFIFRKIIHPDGLGPQFFQGMIKVAVDITVGVITAF